MPMVEKIITEGSKIELQRLSSITKSQKDDTVEIKTYYSLVSEVIDEDRMKITMPLEKGRVVPLPVNGRYNACFYTPNGLYQGRIIVVDRFKEANIYMLVVELTSDLVKFQRRQYYRLGCTMDIKYKVITEQDEKEFVGENQNKEDQEQYIEGTALDISGGGMRFVSNNKIEIGNYIFVIVEIQYENDIKKYGMNAVVISSEALANREGKFEHRIEYKNMDGKVREALIKYIFDEERRQRRKEFEK